MEKKSSKSCSPVAKATSPGKGIKLSSAKGGLQSAVTDCCQVSVCLSNASGSVIYPTPSVKTTGSASCFNASGNENPTATFTVTVSPPTGPTLLCWSVQYSITNNTGGTINLTSLSLQLFQSIDDGPPVSIGSPMPVNNLPVSSLGPGGTVTSIFSSSPCTDISGMTATYSVEGTLIYSCPPGTLCNGVANPTKSTGPLLIINATFQDPNCYFLSDIASATLGLTDKPIKSITINSITASFVPSDCSNLSFVAANIGPGGLAINPVTISPNQGPVTYIQICPDCFPTVPPAPSPDIVFRVTVVADVAPDNCDQVVTITNTATLIKGLQFDSNGGCSGTAAFDIKGNPICLSTESCDEFSATDSEVAQCVVPAVCVTKNLDCKQQFCVCKTSQFIDKLQYDITVKPQGSEVCTVTYNFAFNACTEDTTSYTYQIFGVTGGVQTLILSGVTAPCNSVVNTTGDQCSTCTVDVSQSCLAANQVSFDLANISQFDNLVLFIYNNGNLSQPIVTGGTLICIPEPDAISLCASECITVTGCTPAPGGDCNCTITSENVALNDVIYAKDNLFPDSPTYDAIKQLLFNLVNTCASSSGELISLTHDQIVNLTTYGLHFFLILPPSSSCCGNLTITNVFHLVTGASDCDTLEGFTSDQSYTTRDGLVVTCPPPRSSGKLGGKK